MRPFRHSYGYGFLAAALCVAIASPLAAQWTPRRPVRILALDESQAAIMIGRRASTGTGAIEIVDLVSGLTAYSMESDQNLTAMASTDHYLITGSVDGILEFWSVRGRGQERRAETGIGTITSIQPIGGGRIVLAAGSDGVVQGWDTQTATLDFASEMDGTPITALAVRPSSTTAAFGALDGTLRIYDWNSQQVIQDTAAHGAEITALQYSEERNYLVSAAADGTIRVWNPDSLLPVRDLTVDGGAISSIAYQMDTERRQDPSTEEFYNFSGAGVYAAGQTDGSIALYAARSFGLQGRLMGHTAMVTDVAFVEDEDLLLSVSLDGTVRVWDLKAQRQRSLHTIGTD